MRGVDAVWTSHGSDVPLYPGLTIPVMTHMLFQGMFFIITPALICGAFAERMKFSAMMAFTALWGLLVYCPLAHWIWGGGILAYGSPHAAGFSAGGALDFAGGTVVHISSGVSALVCALLLGKRLGYGSEPMPPHNMTYTALGAAMLWVGWFGFNAGSALSANRLATCAFAATHFAAAAGGLTWAALEWKFRGKPSLLGACSGLVAGLATITQAAGYVKLDAGPADWRDRGHRLLPGLHAAEGLFRLRRLARRFRRAWRGRNLGRSVDGDFRHPGHRRLWRRQAVGLLEGGPLLKAQCIAAITAWGLAIVGTFVILKVVDVAIGLRVARQAEIEGLDMSQHDEEGYIFI